MSDEKKPSIYRHMARGSAWAFLMRWSIRGVGFISTVILARMLVPEDFGLVAISGLAIGLVSSFSELGVAQHLIRKPVINVADCNTAWTMKLLQQAFVAFILALFAPLIASYFSEPRATMVIYVVAVVGLLEGLQNIGMVLVQKELDFAKDFRFNVYIKVAQFIVTISLAFVLKSYWALVIGQVVTTIFGLFLSYLMHPYRPKFSLEKAREFLGLSLYIVPINLARFFRNRFCLLVVGRMETTEVMGYYNVGDDLSAMATQELVLPIGRALSPSYAKIVTEPQKLAEVYLRVFHVVSTFCFAIGVGLSVSAQEVVLVVLGDKWHEVIPILQWLAIYSALTALARTMTGNILIVSGNERLAMMGEWLGLLILVPFVAGGAFLWGVQGVIWGVTISAIVMLPIAAYLLSRAIPVRIVNLAVEAYPAVLSAMVMSLGITFLSEEFSTVPVIGLILKIIVGATLFVGTSLALWWIRGRPEGFERAIGAFLIQRITK